ncbi:hypothetical protein Hdeb2414_s0640g00928021 [Helianthus debilis subsp. tardiflorus]
MADEQLLSRTCIYNTTILATCYNPTPQPPAAAFSSRTPCVFKASRWKNLTTYKSTLIGAASWVVEAEVDPMV